MSRFLSLFLLIVFSTSFSYAQQLDPNIVAFDLDETLIASDRLENSDFATVEELGYELKTSNNGQKYVIRPGAQEILDFAHSLGFDLMIITHNTKSYAKDILNSSALMKNFIDLKANEDMQEDYNHDYVTYPNHRNQTHEGKRSLVATYTKGLYHGLFRRGYLYFTGNKNIHYYIPCYNCDKYPPAYGSRVLIDNSNYNIEEPLDFIGIKVVPFTALKKQALDIEGNYVWVEKLKADLLKLKKDGWISLYQEKYNKAPDATPVLIHKD